MYNCENKRKQIEKWKRNREIERGGEKGKQGEEKGERDRRQRRGGGYDSSKRVKSTGDQSVVFISHRLAAVDSNQIIKK